MRLLKVKLVCFIGLFVGLAAMTGCTGSDDILDENTQRYSASLSFQDFEDDDVLQIDTVFVVDCDGNGIADDPEPFSDAFANITVSVEPGAPGLRLESYSIDYVAIGSADGNSVTVAPPDLVDIPNGFFDFTVPSGSTATFTTTLVSVDTKDEFAIDLGWLAERGVGCVGNPLLRGDGNWCYVLPNPDELLVGRYRIRMTLHFTDEFDVERDIPISRNANFSAYNNC